jgi:hypothetical protein
MSCPHRESGCASTPARAESRRLQLNPDDDSPTPSEQWSCIIKLRRLVVKIRSSPQRRNEFKGLCIACGLPVKELVLDTRTRWNSTHAMIKRACELKDPLSKMATTSRSGLPELSDGEWELLEVVGHVLCTFEEASRPLYGATYPTLNEMVPTYNLLFDDLEGFLGMRNNEHDGREKSATINRCDPVNMRILRDAIDKAHEKLREYYTDAWAGMYAIAVILDPRLKMDYYRANNWEPEHIAHAKDALLQVVEKYGAAAPQPDQADIVDHSQRTEDRRFRGVKRYRVEKGSEVERYLATPTIGESEDVLAWWKQHQDVYPCLARIARDYFAIPATSVPAERVFSGGANLVTKKRGALNEETIEACICLDSWLQC